jgi:hypothetical protein
MKKLNLVCQFCFSIFETKKREKNRDVQKFCSKLCFGKNKQQKRFCLNCNKMLLYSTQNKRTNKHFCSRSCSQTHRSKYGLKEETKQKISVLKQNVPLSQHHKKALRGIVKLSLRGKNHFNYKKGEFIGGKTRDRGRTEYSNWRRSVFERDSYTCQRCKVKNCFLEAHHIEPWATNISKRYEVDNGLTLCKNCHKQIHKEIFIAKNNMVK